MSDWQVVSEKDVRLAIQFLRGKADDLANAVRERAWRDERRKIVLAEMTQASTETAISRAESEARATPAYSEACKAYADAERELAYLKAKMAAAQVTVDAWRTQNANARAHAS